MVLALAAALAHDWYVLPETTSPSGRFAVAWRVSGADVSQFGQTGAPGVDTIDIDASQNWLVDPVNDKPLFRLKGLASFPQENHGGFMATYSPDEEFVAAVHSGKWEPRGFILAATASGDSVDALKVVRKDGATWLKSHDAKRWRRSGKEITFDVSSVKFEEGGLVLGVVSQVPKVDGKDMVFTYRVSAGPKLRLLKAAWAPKSG